MVEMFECWRQLCFASFYTCFEVDLMTEITWNIQTFQYVKIVIDVATVFVMCLCCVVYVCSIGRYTFTRGWAETMSDVLSRCINCSSRYVSFYIWKPYCHVTLTPHNVCRHCCRFVFRKEPTHTVCSPMYLKQRQE